jgi:type I restriction enzyme S subunit
MMMGKISIQSWETVYLEDVVAILDSQRVPVSAKERENRKGDIPYYGATGQVGWIDDYLFDEELILLGEDGAPFFDSTKPVAYLIRGKSWVNNHAHVLMALGFIPNAFLMHQLNVADYRPYVSGTTRHKLSQKPMRKISILIPPLLEQYRIVDTIETYLSRLDAAIAALERVKKNLERYRKSVLKAAVEGHLVPTEAELARKEGRDYESADVLLKRILKKRRKRWEEAEWKKLVERAKQKAAKERRKKAGWPLKRGESFSPDEWQDIPKAEYSRYFPKNDKWKQKYKEPATPDTEGLPELPEGWCWATMPQLGELNRGKSKHRPRNDPRLLGGPYPFIQTGDIRYSDGFIRSYQGTYSEFGLSQSRLWPAGTLCITIAANIAETGILIFDACFPDSVVGFLNEAEPSLTRFIELFLRTARERLDRYAPATAQKNINLAVLSELAVPIPPALEQVRIITEVDRLLSVSSDAFTVAEHNICKAYRLRQSILKWAFEGKLVDQDPNDEPASELLKRIKAERKEMEKERKKQRKDQNEWLKGRNNDRW